MPARRHLLGGVAAVTCVAVLTAGQATAGQPAPTAPVLPPFVEAKVECNYVSRGEPGAADNELRISAGRGFFAFVWISDKSGKLQVQGTERCKGRAEPELDNIDSISINMNRPKFAFVSVKMARSSLSPGFTREADGSSEIEISLNDTRGSVDLSLGGGDDYVTGGMIGEESVGVNLTAGVDDDVDVRGTRRSQMEIGLGDGDDRFSEPAAPPRGLSGGRSIIGFVSGDAGSDLLEGTPNLDFFGGGSGEDTISGEGGFDYLVGGEDDDVVTGEGGGDWIDAVGGRDDVDGGAGGDAFFASDKRRDNVNCGEDGDIAYGDQQRDEFIDCERVRPGPRGDIILLPRHSTTVDRAREFFEHSG